MPERRESLLPDLERLSKPTIEPITFSDKEGMVRQVIANVKGQGYILEASDEEASWLALACINEIEQLHKVPDIVQDPPTDIDVIWIISAPGLLLEHGSKPGWSAQFTWLDNCEWEVVGAGFALAEAVTAKRLQKPVNQVTKDDFKEHGPWVVYNSNPWENEALKTILKESSSLPIPQEKVYIYQPNREDPSYLRTVDQARDLRMPLGVQPRILAISILAAQWVRLGRILAATQSLPENAGLLVVPTLSPGGYESEHAIMETQGAVINAYKHHNAGLDPIKYQLN